MRQRFVPRQLIAAVIAGVCVSGCSLADFVTNPVGVGAPSPSKVSGYLIETTSDAVINANGQAMTAGEYLIASMAYTNEKCHAFFDTLERFKEDSSLIDKVLTAAAAAGSPLLAATSSSGVAVAKFASILNFSNSINTSYRDIYTFSDFKEPLQTHVYDLMGGFRIKNGLSTLTRSLVGVNLFAPHNDGKINPISYGTTAFVRDGACYDSTVEISAPTTANPSQKVAMSINSCRVNDFLRSTDPIHLLVARNIASEYASLCSISSMRTIIYQALHATKSDVAKADSSAAVITPVTKP